MQKGLTCTADVVQWVTRKGKVSKMPKAQLNLSSPGDAAEFQQLFADFHATEHDKSSKAFKDAELALRTKIGEMSLRDLMANEARFAPVIERCAA